MLRTKEKVGTSTAPIEASSSVAAISTPATAVASQNRPTSLSDFIAQFDEAAMKRLVDMNNKLKGLERQMELLEEEMHSVNQASAWRC